jgi:hypothetical protein
MLAMLMLAPSAIIFAQDEPILVLSEEQINADFTIPSTAARQISNLKVDVQEDGVHISFDVRDGSSNTLSIIAVLIGLVQPRVNQMSFYDLLISSYVTPPRDARREVASVVTRAWSNYVRGVAEENALSLSYAKIEYLMEDDGIFFFGSEAEDSGGPDVQWCLECSKP